MSEEKPFQYDATLAAGIEKYWQEQWTEGRTFAAANPVGPLSAGFEAAVGRPKAYVLDMFPYPSGSGLHVGHPLGYITTDVYARFLRMTGHHVLHTFGYDAFGLPAEQYAISTGQHPAVTARANIAIMRGQLQRLGLGHDLRREISTTDPAYYRWTQWIFLQLFGSWCDQRTGRARPIGDLIAEYESGERDAPDGRGWAGLSVRERRAIIDGHRLAYLSEEPVNWCPGLGTVLANEEVTAEGRSDVGNYPVFQRSMRQWMLRITAFAGRLDNDLGMVDWPESLKLMQRNWIAGMRDWLFSRQRYWGEPFPIVYDEDGQPLALPEDLLPVRLPHTDDFRPVPAEDEEAEPVPPLGRIPGWAEVELDLGSGPRRYRREVNTMPQWAGSSWYYLRYLDPGNDEHFVRPEIESYWMRPNGVDLYVGGVEHAVLHLLYARFWHKVLFDLGHVSTPEPFGRLVNQGYVQADAFTDARGMYVPAAQVSRSADGQFWFDGHAVTRRIGRMGKSRKNGISPDDMIDQYGADTLRLYEMSMGPVTADRPWQPDDIAGSHRLLRRLWRSIVDERTGATLVTDRPLTESELRRLHAAIATVRDDVAGLRYHTAVARLGELAAEAARISAAESGLPRSLAEPLTLMFAPLVPHIAEELWRRMGHGHSLAHEPFPVADPMLATRASIRVPVQVNGKTRFTVEVPVGATAAEIETLLTAMPEYGEHVRGAAVLRLVIVPGRIVNILTGGSSVTA